MTCVDSDAGDWGRQGSERGLKVSAQSWARVARVKEWL